MLTKFYQYTARGYFAGPIFDPDGFMPNNSTRTAPPEAQEGFIAKYDKETDSWSLVENHKGEEGYLEGKPYTIQDFGPVPVGFSKNPPKKLFSEIKAEKLAEINGGFSEMVSRVSGDYTQGEVNTIDQQVEEANAYMANNNAACPMLRSIADARGITMDDLCQKVLAKHTAYSIAVGKLLGQRQKLEQKLEECTTAAQVEKITVAYSIN